MTMKRQTKTKRIVDFTAEEHLQVQMEIEKGAYESWHQRGSRPNASLTDWIEAEREILEGFCLSRLGRRFTRTGFRNATATRRFQNADNEESQPSLLPENLSRAL